MLEADDVDAVFNATWAQFVKDWHSGVQRTGDGRREARARATGAADHRRSARRARRTLRGRRRRRRLRRDRRPRGLPAARSRTTTSGSASSATSGSRRRRTLREHLERRGLLQVLRRVVVQRRGRRLQARSPRSSSTRSARVGNPSPDRVAHVGDLRRTDIAGALAMGMIAVRYAGVFDDPAENGPEATLTISHYSELPALLDL